MTCDSYVQFPLQFLIKIIERWPMTAMGHFQYNSLSKSLKYDTWPLKAIPFTNPCQNNWNMTCDCYGQFPLQFLIKITEIWPVKAMGHLNDNSFITIIETWAMTAMGHFLYNFLSKSLKYDLWQRWTISITIPYQNHWNMSYDCYGPSPLQFLIKTIEI